LRQFTKWRQVTTTEALPFNIFTRKPFFCRVRPATSWKLGFHSRQGQDLSTDRLWGSSSLRSNGHGGLFPRG
jgi:hypothetical protein